MLDLLCRIRYSRLLFVVISGSGIGWLWHGMWQHDNSNPVNGVVTLDVGMYIFVALLIFMLTFAFLALLNLMFDLDFQYKSDKIQDYFKEIRRKKERAALSAAQEERNRAYEQSRLEAKERADVQEFIQFCQGKVKKGGMKNDYN